MSTETFRWAFGTTDRSTVIEYDLRESQMYYDTATRTVLEFLQVACLVYKDLLRLGLDLGGGVNNGRFDWCSHLLHHVWLLWWHFLLHLKKKQRKISQCYNTRNHKTHLRQEPLYTSDIPLYTSDESYLPVPPTKYQSLDRTTDSFWAATKAFCLCEKSVLSSSRNLLKTSDLGFPLKKRLVSMIWHTVSIIGYSKSR